jgi:O-antigen ligase
MTARARLELLPSSLFAAAILLGALAAFQPLIAIAAVAGIAFCYVVFVNLAAGFAVLAFLAFLDILPTSGSLSPSKGAGLLLAVAWLARTSIRERSDNDFFRDFPYITWLLVLFAVWASITLVWATSTSSGVTAITRYIPNMMLLPIACTALRGRRELRMVIVAIVAGAIIAAAFGLVAPPNPELAEDRATGTIGDPNELAAALLVGLTLGVGLLLARGAPAWMRLLGAFAVPLCAAGIFLSLSRGGLIALGAVLLAGTLLAGRWRLALTAILVVVAVGGVVYFTQLAPLPARERITASNGGSGRDDLWKVGLRMVKAHPIEGVGVGNFQVVSKNYVLQPGSIARTDLIFAAEPKIAHNTYLQILSETGIPGLALVLAIFLSSLICAWRAARIWAARNEQSLEALARAVLLSLIGILVADFFISQMYSKLLWALLALGPAMLLIARHETDEVDEQALELAPARSPEPAPAR